MTSSSPMPHLTPTETRLYQLLLDGQRHSQHELMGLLWDDLSGPSVLAAHLSYLRKKLPDGQFIISQRISGDTYYRITVPLVPYSLP